MSQNGVFVPVIYLRQEEQALLFTFMTIYSLPAEQLRQGHFKVYRDHKKAQRNELSEIAYIVEIENGQPTVRVPASDFMEKDRRTPEQSKWIKHTDLMPLLPALPNLRPYYSNLIGGIGELADYLVNSGKDPLDFEPELEQLVDFINDFAEDNYRRQYGEVLLAKNFFYATMRERKADVAFSREWAFAREGQPKYNDK